MPSIVDAELTLRATGGAAAAGYQAEFSIDTGRDSPPRYGPFPVPLDLDRLRSEAGDPAAYGKALTGMLFHADGLREALAGARATAAERGVPLRLRLWLASGAEPLHALSWELLTLPGRSEPLCTREDILFSRYLPAGADSPAPRPKDRPRALVAIASPDDLGSGGLAPIDVPAWQAHARSGLVGMAIEWLPPLDAETASAGSRARCTLTRLVERIPGQDVLFLVCHGKLAGGEGQLLLEDAQGGRTPVKASELARRLGGTLRLPRLAVLVVCESASDGDLTENAALAALGPRLVALGIPAVLAMQGALSFETADLFFPALFRALQEDSAIDWAVARARRAIAGQADERAPVLLMSLKSGRLWAEAAQTPAPAAAVVTPHAGPARQVDQRPLYAALTGPAFTLSDLEELSFNLNIDWDLLRGQTKTEKARALIRYCTSRGDFARLVMAVREARPELGL